MNGSKSWGNSKKKKKSNKNGGKKCLSSDIFAVSCQLTPSKVLFLLVSPQMSTKTVDIHGLLSRLGGNAAQLAAKLPNRGSRFPGDEADIALFIQRSKNQNVVCYKAVYENRSSDTLKPDAPIDAYWLDVDPEYVKANRKNGKMDDRCELNLIDRTMAYGHSVAPPTAVAGGGSPSQLGCFEVSFVALSDRKMMLTSVGGGTPVVLSKVDGEDAVVTRIYVKASEPKHFWQMPSVEYVELHGFNPVTGEAVLETVKPK
jgi:hypothetical protein